jgi:tape measure domain-containing protein
VASAFELLEAYVTISERGAAATIAKLRQVEAAAIAAGRQNVNIVIDANILAALQQLGGVTNITNTLNVLLRQTNTLVQNTNNNLSQTVNITRSVTNNTQNITNNMNRAATSALNFRSVLGGLGAFTGGLFTLNTAIRAVGAAFEESFAREKSFVVFRQLIGNAEEATNVLRQLEAFSRRTPFEFGELRTTAQQLIALGSSTENVLGEISRISNVAAGSGAALDRVVRAYTQIRSNQQLFGEELNQLGDAGVPILQELAKNLDTTTRGVRVLASQGKIGFDEVENAFRTLTEEGGKFANIIDELGTTTPALLKNIGEEARKTGAELAGMYDDDINESLKNALFLLQEMRREAEARRAAESNTQADGGGVLKGFQDFNYGLGPALKGITDFNEQVTQTREAIEAAAKPAPGIADIAEKAIPRWKQLNKEIRDFDKDVKLAARINSDFLTPFDQLTAKILDIRALTNQGLLTPEISGQAIAKAREEYEKLIETQNKLSDAWEEILELADKDFQASESIRRDLITPFEELEAKIREIERLRIGGNLTDGLADRAIAKAIEEYDKLISRQEKLNRAVARTSFTVGTAEELRFRMETNSDQKRATQLAEEQARLQKEANALLAQIRDELESADDAEVNQDTFDTGDFF